MHRNWPLVVLIVRLILGILFFMAGFWKVFELTPGVHAAKFFVNGFADSWIPAWLLSFLGHTIPFVELIAGAMILLGYRTRETLVALGMLLVVTTYGHALQQPLFDIDGHTFTRLALIVFLLLAPIGSDRYSLDGVLSRR